MRLPDANELRGSVSRVEQRRFVDRLCASVGRPCAGVNRLCAGIDRLWAGVDRFHAATAPSVTRMRACLGRAIASRRGQNRRNGRPVRRAGGVSDDRPGLCRGSNVGRGRARVGRGRRHRDHAALGANASRLRGSVRDRGDEEEQERGEREHGGTPPTTPPGQ